MICANAFFFPRHKNEVMKEVVPFLTKDTAGIVVSYVLGKENPFGPQEWKRYFGVEITDAPQLRRSFYTWWFAPDPVEPSKQRCETHLPPILRPAGMSLEKLGELVQNPKEGNKAKWFDSAPLRAISSLISGPTCFLIMRKDVLARNRTYADQQKFIKELNSKSLAGYEVEPSIIDLATVVFLRYIYTNERYLGNNLEITTRSYVKEIDEGNRLSIGGFYNNILCVGFAYHPEPNESAGIAAVKKF